MQTITINKNDVGQRLDSFLKKTFPKLSLSSMYRFIRTKRIKLNGKKADISTRLILNDKLELYVNDELLSKKISNDDFLIANSKLDVVFEDNNVIIINKPAGLVVHDDETKTANTLVNILKHYLYKKGE
jgi:23S rRNA pseudouridine955/2504/2580 synthase